MKYFSDKNILHLFVAGLYGAARCTMDHFMVKSVMPLSLRHHMYLESSVAFALHLVLKDCIWFASLSLNVVDVRPMYSLVGSSSALTVAL